MSGANVRRRWWPATCVTLWHPFTAHSAWPDDDPLVIDARPRACTSVRHRRQPLSRRRLVAVAQRARPRRAGDRRGDPRPARPPRPRDLPRPHPRAGHRACRAAARHRAGRPDPGVLRGRRLLRRRGRDQDGVPGDRASRPAPYGRSTSTSPRATTATPSGRSASAASSCSTRPTGRSCSTPAWCRLRACSPRARRRAARAAEVLAEMRAVLRARGRPGVRRRDRAARAGGRRHAHPRPVVRRRRARAVRRVRRADGRRRGGHRHRPHRTDVGGRPRRRHARPDDLRQGPDRRLPAALGRARPRVRVRGVPRCTVAGPHVLPRALLHRQPAVLRRGAGQPAPDDANAARWPHAAQVGERMGELLKGVEDVRRGRARSVAWAR